MPEKNAVCACARRVLLTAQDSVLVPVRPNAPGRVPTSTAPSSFRVNVDGHSPNPLSCRGCRAVWYLTVPSAFTARNFLKRDIFPHQLLGPAEVQFVPKDRIKCFVLSPYFFVFRINEFLPWHPPKMTLPMSFSSPTFF